MSELVKQYVIRLQVPVYNSCTVQLLQSKDKLRNIKLRVLLFKPNIFLKNMAEVATLHEFHNHVQELLGLESVHAPGNKVSVQSTEDRLLVHDRLHAILLLHLLYLEHLDGVEIVGVLLPGKDDFAIGASRQSLEKQEVVDCHPLLHFVYVVDRAALLLRWEVAGQGPERDLARRFYDNAACRVNFIGELLLVWWL